MGAMASVMASPPRVAPALLALALLAAGCEGPAGPPGPQGPPGPAADAAPDPDAAPRTPDAAPRDAAPLDAALPDAAVPDAAPLDATLPDAALPDAAAPEPCPPWTPPAGLGGPAAAVVDEAEAARWRAYAAARHDERLREALDPAAIAARYRIEQADIDRGCVPFGDLVDLGRGIFLRRFTLAEGYGNALAGVPGTDAGDRPPPNLRRLQRGRFGGPDAARCSDCHWKGGLAGAGDRADNSFLYGDGDDLATHEIRNPPALWGAGWTERIAAEMSAELAATVDAARAEAAAGAPVTVDLVAKGTHFGRITVAPDGAVDTRAVEGIDPDLVVKPFGWKGVFPTLRAFVTHSLAIHFGLQAEGLVAAPGELDLGGGPEPDDPDADGVRREITEGQLTALVAFLATLPAPDIEIPVEGGFADPFAPELPIIVDAPEFALRWADGAALFEGYGCALCHTPLMEVRDPVYRTAPGGIDGIGGIGGIDGIAHAIDLSTHAAAPRPARDPDRGVWLVPVFSDFKRHDMGPLLTGRHPERGVPAAQWMTRRLWGVGQTGPYLHDGSAATFDEAIARHGGEAAFAAEAYLAAPDAERAALRVFLGALRRAPAIRIR